MSYIRYNLHLDLHATDVCGFSCPWCAYDAGRRPYVLPLEEAKRVFEEAAAHGIREVHIYGGEVLHLDAGYVAELLRLARERFDHVGLLTRGQPLERFKAALPFLDSAFISLHPELPDTYKAVRLASSAGVKARTSVVVDRIAARRNPMEFAARAHESGADNIAFMYMSPVSEFLDPTTWRRSLKLWLAPAEWIQYLRRLKEAVPEGLQAFVRVQPAYAGAPRGCEIHEHIRRVVYYKGRYYLCHMAIPAGIGAATIEEALKTRGAYGVGRCVGYVQIAKSVASADDDYRNLAGVPPGYAPECPMRTVKLSDLRL
jgi:sulfatase maturation enzyme AslB (radical SAM superfamily)